MTNAITISKSNNSHKVVWDESVKRFIDNIDFLELSFKKTKSHEIGLIIQLHGNGYDTLWIDERSYFDKRFNEYSLYLRDMYNIYGVEFKNENDAHTLYDEISKQYMWKILKHG